MSSTSLDTDDATPERALDAAASGNGPTDGPLITGVARPDLVDRLLAVRPETWASLFVVGSCVVFVFLQLQPRLVFTATTPAGGDMGAHVWAPDYLRSELLPRLRLSGWTPDWYTGFPAFHFYMVVPMLAIVLLDVVLPYGIAFKLVAISGALALPVAAWGFGRLAGIGRPGPELLAVASVGFLFDRTYSILGGNLFSTLAGEFAFSISLSLAVLYLGLVANGLRTGRYRALAAVVVALVALTHVIPLFFALAGTVVLLALYPSRAGLTWVLTSGPVGALLSLWWLLPFWAQRAFMNDMGWEKKHPPADAGTWEQVGFWTSRLFPSETRLVAYAAAVALVVVILRRSVPGMFFVGMILVGSIAFVLVPQGRLWNERLLPFVHLCTYLLVAVGFAQVVRWIAEAARSASRPWIRSGGALVGLAVGLALVAFPLRVMPFGSLQSDGSYRWLMFRTHDVSQVPSWARWNFEGYQEKDAWPEYHDVLLTMSNIGDRHGCGRAMWEYDISLDRYGTPMALMLLPTWTDGCIASMEGLYFESSSTTPYHFMNQSALSENPSRTQREMPYTGFDIELGIDQLQLMGVRYYMAFSDVAIRAASSHEALEEIGRSGMWVIYQVADAPLVEPLVNEPIVRTDIHDAMHEWVPSTAGWFQSPWQWDLFWASSGPEHWQRVDDPGDAEHRSQPAVEVTDIDAGTDWVRFRVSEPGTPVLVKTSYFPNWRVSGAEGPWRVTPNFMVVIPTDTTVELHYGRSAVELAGWGLTGIGLVLLVLLARSRPLAVPAWTGEEDDDDDRFAEPPVEPDPTVSDDE